MPASLLRNALLGALLCGGVLLAPSVCAVQTPAMTLAYEVDTGKPAIDRLLRDINYYAERHPDAFIDEIVWHANGQREPLTQWLSVPGRQAADVYFACQLAMERGMGCMQMLRHFAASADGGWPTVLAELEPPMTAAQWKSLHARMLAGYARWARPLPDGTRTLR